MNQQDDCQVVVELGGDEEVLRVLREHAEDILQYLGTNSYKKLITGGHFQRYLVIPDYNVAFACKYLAARTQLLRDKLSGLDLTESQEWEKDTLEKVLRQLELEHVYLRAIEVFGSEEKACKWLRDTHSDLCPSDFVFLLVIRQGRGNDVLEYLSGIEEKMSG